VIEFLRDRLSAGGLAVYPEYGEAKRALAGFFQVPQEQLLLTNGTDEAIQVFSNTYVNAGDEVVLLRPAYAMYRFYASVAGAEIREVGYRLPLMDFPLDELLDVITPATRAVVIANPNNPTGTAVQLHGIERILKRTRGLWFSSTRLLRFCGITALPLIERAPNLFVSRTFSKVFGMAVCAWAPCFRIRRTSLFLHKAQSPPA
jgi:histidinol-phosphate aminotransferase